MGAFSYQEGDSEKETALMAEAVHSPTNQLIH